MNVTVFGGAQPKEGETAYEQARELGALLAQNGHTVLTGGYMGTMEAVSRGAHENGGHVVGITCEEIEAWRPAKANRWVKEERKRATLVERMTALIRAADAAIALPGGVGTLAEITLTWNLLVVEALPPRPLILVGSGWQPVFDQFFRSFESYTSSKQRDLLRFAEDAKTAVKLLEIRD